MPTTNNDVDTTLSSVHLDAIRGAAALVVLLGHTRELFFFSLTGTQKHVASLSKRQDTLSRPVRAANANITIGNEAVMIFFVLSGYLVGGSVIKALRHNTWSFRHYLAKRLTRLWVVLIPALLLGVALDYTGMHFFPNQDAIYAGPSSQSLVTSDVASRLSVRVIAANAVFLQSILVKTAGTNESLWSLTNEFWYYLTFPLFLLALKNNQGWWQRGAYLLTIGGIALLVGINISLLFLIWVLGALLSIAPLVIPQKIAKILSGLLVGIGPIILIMVRRATLPIYIAEWIVALFSALTIYFLLHQTEKSQKGLYRNIAGFFSRISYTLYLVHLPLAVLLCAFVNNPWHRWSKSPQHLAIFLALNTVLVLVSYLIYLLFEAKTDMVRRALFHRRAREKHLPTRLGT